MELWLDCSATRKCPLYLARLLSGGWLLAILRAFHIFRKGIAAAAMRQAHSPANSLKIKNCNTVLPSTVGVQLTFRLLSWVVSRERQDHALVVASLLVWMMSGCADCHRLRCPFFYFWETIPKKPAYHLLSLKGTWHFCHPLSAFEQETGSEWNLEKCHWSCFSHAYQADCRSQMLQESFLGRWNLLAVRQG